MCCIFCLVVLTTKVWQRAMALFTEGLVGSPGHLPGMQSRVATVNKITPFLEESCKEEVSIGPFLEMNAVILVLMEELKTFEDLTLPRYQRPCLSPRPSCASVIPSVP